jgi:hypothetical protein
MVERMRVGVRVSSSGVTPRRLAAALKRAWAPEVSCAVKTYADMMARNDPDGGAAAAQNIMEFAMAEEAPAADEI